MRTGAGVTASLKGGGRRADERRVSRDDPTEPRRADEVVAAVADDEEARPLIETLLLAGLGPSTRPGLNGTVEVTVVAGQGGRARAALEGPESAPAPFVDVTPEISDPDDGAGRPRYSMLRVLLLFAVAMVGLPVLAFYISYRVSGG